MDESCRANMPKAEACLYGELGKGLRFVFGFSAKQ